MAVIDAGGWAFSTNISDYSNYGLYAGSFPYSGGSIQTNGPLGDNWYLNSVIGGGSITRTLLAGANSFFFGGRFMPSTNVGSTNGCYINFNDVLGSEQFHVVFLNGTPGSISVYRGGTLLGTANAVVYVNGAVWSWVEVGATISSTVGTVTVRINGVTVISLTNVNNQGSATSLTTVQQWSYIGGGNGGIGMQHWYFCDNSGGAPWNTFLGDVRVSGAFPTGAGSSTQFTPNGLASNYLNAAKMPPAPTTDYNSGSTVGNLDLFTFGTAPASIIYAVLAKVLAAKSDSGGRSIQTALKSGATTALGNSTALSTSFVQHSSVYETDPATSAQWTAAGYNALNGGYEISA